MSFTQSFDNISNEVCKVCCSEFMYNAWALNKTNKIKFLLCNLFLYYCIYVTKLFSLKTNLR